MKFQVVFQSKSSSSGTSSSEDGSSGGNTVCTNEKLIMSSADMKALKVRIGGYVQLDLPSQTRIVCRVWTSKKNLPAGSASLNRIWMPNFSDTARRQAEISAVGKK